jgi:hypothetical protein
VTQWLLDSWKTTTKVTGPQGARIRVGKFLLPRHVFVDYAGKGGQPDLHLHLEWRDDRPQVVELSIKAKRAGRGVRSSDLEVLALDGIARAVFESVALTVEDHSDGYTVATPANFLGDPDAEREFWKLDKDIADAIASRRGGTTTADLEKVAAMYQKHPTGALQAIAAALGVSERTAARRVKAARAAGLLSGKATTSGEGES